MFSPVKNRRDFISGFVCFPSEVGGFLSGPLYLCKDFTLIKDAVLRSQMAAFLDLDQTRQSHDACGERATVRAFATFTTSH